MDIDNANCGDFQILRGINARVPSLYSTNMKMPSNTKDIISRNIMYHVLQPFAVSDEYLN